MGAEQLPLLKELSGGKLYSSAIFGTYQFDGVFFEDEVLPVLNQLDVANIVVLTDTQGYTEAGDLKQAGQAYYIDHVRCPGIHHPKFTALFGRDHGRAFVGSANLTEQGWQHSGELMTVVDYPEENNQSAPFFIQLRRFIEQLSTSIHSSRATAAIEEAFRDAPWLADSPDVVDNSRLQLLHNCNEPLLTQVLESIDNQSIEEIEIFSPFFSGTDPSTFETICDLSPERVRINLQPDRVEGFDAEVLTDDYFDGIEVTVNDVALTGDDSDRYLHAKLLLLKGPDGAWTLYGSPNFTTPALLETKDTGNIELGVLRYEPERDYFDYLFDSETADREPITPEAVTYRPPSSTESSEEDSDFHLTDAYLDLDGTLIIEHEESPPSRAIIQLKQATADEAFNFDISEPSSGTLEFQDERIPQLCQQSCQVELTLEYSGSTHTSDPRWVALPTLENTTRPSEVQNVENSDGRDGLIEVLDRLPTWGVICQFLANVDFRQIEVTHGDGPIGGGIGPGPSNGGGMEEWNPKTRDEIFEEKSQTLLRKIEDTREKLILNPTDPQQFESFVNQYVALSKLVLWWESQEPRAHTHLSKVRTATEAVGKFLEQLTRHGELDAGRALEREHSLLEHVAIIMCYVNELQRHAGHDSGANQNVYEVFQATNRDVLLAFEDIRGQSVPSVGSLNDCLDEYSPIDAVSVSAKRVKYYCADLVE